MIIPGNKIRQEHRIAVAAACRELPEPFGRDDVLSWLLDKRPDVRVASRHISRVMHLMREQGCLVDVYNPQNQDQNKYKRSRQWQ